MGCQLIHFPAASNVHRERFYSPQSPAAINRSRHLSVGRFRQTSPFVRVERHTDAHNGTGVPLFPSLDQSDRAQLPWSLYCPLICRHFLMNDKVPSTCFKGSPPSGQLGTRVFVRPSKTRHPPTCPFLNTAHNTLAQHWPTTGPLHQRISAVEDPFTGKISHLGRKLALKGAQTTFHSSAWVKYGWERVKDTKQSYSTVLYNFSAPGNYCLEDGWMAVNAIPSWPFYRSWWCSRVRCNRLLWAYTASLAHNTLGTLSVLRPHLFLMEVLSLM